MRQFISILGLINATNTVGLFRENVQDTKYAERKMNRKQKELWKVKVVYHKKSFRVKK